MSSQVNATPVSRPPDTGRLGARGEKLLASAAAVFLAAALILGWRAYFHIEEGDPVASALGTFERRNDLVVLTYRFQVVAESVIKGPIDLSVLERRQLVIIPATIDYRVELSKIKASNTVWDAQKQVLSITLPPLRTSRPNLDEGKARAFTDGVWVSREDAVNLARKNSQIAERRALEFAKDKEVLGLAREAARNAVRDNLAAILAAAGHPAAKIEVDFAGEQ